MKPLYEHVIIITSMLLLIVVLVLVVNTEQLKTNDISEVEEGTIPLPTNFHYTYKHFKVYNSEVDTETVILFNNVCAHYQLDTTKELLDLCIGQILYESGAQHHYVSDHPKKGQLVRSYAGAIGISQIMPNTAYGIIRNLSPKNAAEMLKLGCTPVYSIRYHKSIREGSKEWVTQRTNNIILWGHIMKTNLSKRPNMYKALVSYNSGIGGMIKFVNNGGSVYRHKYVRGIRNTLKVVKRSSDHEKVS